MVEQLANRLAPLHRILPDQDGSNAGSTPGEHARPLRCGRFPAIGAIGGEGGGAVSLQPAASLRDAALRRQQEPRVVVCRRLQPGESRRGRREPVEIAQRRGKPVRHLHQTGKITGQQGPPLPLQAGNRRRQAPFRRGSSRASVRLAAACHERLEQRFGQPDPATVDQRVRMLVPKGATRN